MSEGSRSAIRTRIRSPETARCTGYAAADEDQTVVCAVVMTSYLSVGFPNAYTLSLDTGRERLELVDRLLEVEEHAFPSEGFPERGMLDDVENPGRQPNQPQ